MHYLLSLSFKFALWGVLLLSFGSHGVPAPPRLIATPLPGSYTLRVNGSHNIALNGRISFDRVEKTRKTDRNVMRLQLQGNNPGSDHQLGFIISSGKEATGLQPGRYKINGHINGFMQTFDGVFAFASIPVLGEKPYFAREGSITISRVGKNYVSGSLSISVENPGEEILKISGDFNAVAGN